jgi:predicted RecA/RadA family phage recombinase
MARTEVFRHADSLTLPVPAGALAGEPVAVGALVGILETSRDAAGNATVIMRGGHPVTCPDAVASVGLALYITPARAITTTVGTNVLFGYSLATKGAGAGTVLAKIHQV